MAQLSDFISRIFSTDRTQGLSGGAEVVVDPDPANTFYASRLKKHRTDEDFIEDADLLWSTVSFGGRRGGLRAHVTAERGDGVAGFTDVLIVLNQADARRAGSESWFAAAADSLAEKFRAWCEKERFELLYGTRPLQVRFVEDGGTEMLGNSFNLGPGEFVTGLLPNLYVGPAPRSRPVLAVHLNLPGVWEGYREVGRLFQDQILFTLGRHWLDNYHHVALREPGLYRLQQYPDGSLVHVISPELQDRYLVRSDQLDSGASVLTVAERNGPAVAYLVLAVVEQSTTMEVFLSDVVQAQPVAPARAEAPRVDMPAPPPAKPERPSADPAKSDALRRELLQRTIVPDADKARILTLQERGALLQRVHFGDFMDGYDVYVGGGGRVATQMSEPRATLQVRGNKVALLVHDSNVRVGGAPPQVGKTVPLVGQVDIEVDGHVLQYRDLSGVAADGWPYLGEVRRPGGGAYLDFGGTYRVGRDRRCKVRLPDEPHNENIAWKPQVGGGTTIRSRTGDIPKARFYTDSIMVASEHAELDLGAEPKLRSLARHCFTYVRRGERILSLAPREGASAGPGEVPLQPGDEVLVGNCLFVVSYPPLGGEEDAPEPISDIVAASPSAARASPPTRPPVRELPPEPVGFLPPPAHVDDVPLPAHLATASGTSPAAPAAPADQPPIRPYVGATRTVEVPSAGGLGERGPAPRPPRLQDAATDIGEPPVQPRKPDNRPAPTQKAAPPIQPPIATPLQPPVKATPPSAPPVKVAPPTTSPPPPKAAPSAPPVQPPAGPARTAPVIPPAKSLPPPGKVPPPMILEEPEPPPPPPAATGPLMEEEDLRNSDGVFSVEEAQWKLELTRPGRLVQIGWMVSGEVVVGNHRGSPIVVPEVCAFPEQAFLTLDYFRLFVRGKKANATLLQEGEARLLVNGAQVAETADLDHATLEIVRRDANLEPDFDVVLRVQRDADLPDPRARLLTVDTSDRLVRALFTLGFPMRADRRTRLGPVRATFRFDGALLRITDYLESYRDGGAFAPFFVREGDRPWQTLPEDGSRVELSPGDQVIAGIAVYRFEA